jgi:hypothetical protein
MERFDVHTVSAVNYRRDMQTDAVIERSVQVVQDVL